MMSRFWRILHCPAAPTDNNKNNNNPSLRQREKNLKLVSHLVTWPRRITRLSPILSSSSILTIKTYSKTPSPRARTAQGEVMGSLRFQKVPTTLETEPFYKGKLLLLQQSWEKEGRKERKGRRLPLKFFFSFFSSFSSGLKG